VETKERAFFLHESKSEFFVFKCVQLFLFFSINDALRTDDCVEINISVDVTVNFSSITTFCFDGFSFTFWYTTTDKWIWWSWRIGDQSIALSTL